MLRIARSLSAPSADGRTRFIRRQRRSSEICAIAFSRWGIASAGENRSDPLTAFAKVCKFRRFAKLRPTQARGGRLMALRTGGGDHLYEVVEEWGEMPKRWMYDIAGVAVDSRGNVFMFNRGETPVIILDSDGKLLHSWGDKQSFPRA